MQDMTKELVVREDSLKMTVHKTSVAMKNRANK